MQDTWVWSLGWEDTLEKGMAPTPVFWPVELHAERSLPAYSPQSHKESDTAGQLSLSLSSVAQSSPTFYDPMDCSTPSLPVHHQLLESTQTHVHWVGDAIQPSHPLFCPLLLLPSIFTSIRDFSNESVLCIRWPKYWSFSFSISPSNEYSGLISFIMDWLDLLAVQGTLKSLHQHHRSKATILWHSAFFIVQFSHPYMLTRWPFVGKVMSRLMLSRFVIAFLLSSKVKVKESEVTQSCPTLCNPVDCSLPGSSVHGILQARVLKWVPISFSRGYSRPRDRIGVSHIVGRRFNLWATREAHKEQVS